MAILSAKPKRGSGGHWYTATGEPRHTMPKANGDGERNTTLRDAKKYKLFPSVTGILGLFAKPGLDRWKQDQLLRIAYDNPVQNGESYERFADRCLLEHEKPVEEAADFGTRIHDAIEKYFEGFPVDDDLIEYVQPAFDWKQENQLRFIEREKMMVNLEHGFAGTVDIVGKGPEGAELHSRLENKEDEKGGQGNQLRFSDSSDCGLWGDLLWRGSDDE